MQINFFSKHYTDTLLTLSQEQNLKLHEFNEHCNFVLSTNRFMGIKDLNTIPPIICMHLAFNRLSYILYTPTLRAIIELEINYDPDIGIQSWYP